MTTAKDIADKITKAMEGVTPGRWCQFHPSYAPEAVGAPFSDWDSSHDMSAVEDGRRTKRIATFKHADDAAYADLVQPDNIRILLSALADAEERAFEAEEIIKERDDRLALVDRIADLIGLPEGQELDQVSFELWFSAAESTVSSQASLLEEARRVVDKPFCVLFLDGRNEHGSHVLPSYPRGFEPNDDDMSDQAEAILVEAERLGFAIGEHVWAEFISIADQIGDEGRVELSGYWEFSGINVEMSRAINSSLLLKLEASPNDEA